MNIFCKNCRNKVVKDIRDKISCKERMEVWHAIVDCDFLQGHPGKHQSKQNEGRDYLIVWK